MKKISLIASLVVLTLLAACNSSDNPVASSNSKLNGTWTYAMQSTDTLTISVTLSETDGKITGNYDYTLIDVTVSGNATFTVKSHRIDSDLTGTFSKNIVVISFGDFKVTGNLSSDETQIVGTAVFNDGQNTSNYSVTLQKQ